jgi:hypothetical protein
MTEPVEEYLCVGICMLDPDSGYCMGCGRPPLPVSDGDHGIVAEVQVVQVDRYADQHSLSDPDTPGAE